MARLRPTERAELPDRAFAYIDSHGRRRLPIVDAAHVRAALARFNQVAFEDDAARDRARTRLLNAAKKHGIVPVGFIDGQLRPGRNLPSGFVTLLMSDIEESSTLVHRLGDGYARLIRELRATLRTAARKAGGHVVEARADEFFAVFERPQGALDAAVAIQRHLALATWPDDATVRVRIGVHSGYPRLSDANYIGIPVHMAARICAAGHGGQIVVSGDTRLALTGVTLEGLRFRALGTHRLRGMPSDMALFQVLGAGLERRFPPLRVP